MSEIRRAVVKSYDAAAHKADVQIAGSLAVWLDAVRVATNIPPADVVSGRQCTVLFLDPSNQDDAVVISIQGVLPSTGEILVATATASLTLTTTAQSITGDGDSSKLRLLLPTPGDWLIEATADFHITTLAAGFSCIGELFVNDSASAESGAIIKEMEAKDRATVAQRWKVTTTADDTPVELKARKDGGSGVGVASATHTRLTATGVNRSAASAISPSGTVVSETNFGQAAAAGSASPYSRGDHTHGTPANPVPAHAAIVDAHAMLAATNTWAALQTFNAGINVANIITLTGATGVRRIQQASSYLQIDEDAAFVADVRIISTNGQIELPRLIRDPANIDRILFIAGAGTQIQGDLGATGFWTGELFLKRTNPYDAALSVKLAADGTNPPRFAIHPGDATGFAGRWINAWGPGGGGALDVFLWRLAANTLALEIDRLLVGAKGTPDVGAVLDLQGTRALLLPRLTTTQRNALTGVDGMIIYNTTTQVIEAYENGAWVNV